MNNEYNLKNLIPELVEKKDPPIIVNIKKIKERLSGELSKDENWMVRASVGFNGNTPKEVVSKLKNDKNNSVVYYSSQGRRKHLALPEWQKIEFISSELVQKDDFIPIKDDGEIDIIQYDRTAPLELELQYFIDHLEAV